MHLYLMGYRGSGKSTVARLLAQAMDRSVVDTDEWIESAAGQTVSEIFAQRGEGGFRDLEETAVAQVARLDEPAVVALGGGAVLRPANQSLLRQTGHCVWLQGSPEQLYARIRSDSTSPDRRPSLTGRSGLEEVTDVLAAREPIYRGLAHFIVSTDGKLARSSSGRDCGLAEV